MTHYFNPSMKECMDCLSTKEIFELLDHLVDKVHGPTPEWEAFLKRHGLVDRSPFGAMQLEETSDEQEAALRAAYQRGMRDMKALARGVAEKEFQSNKVIAKTFSEPGYPRICEMIREERALVAARIEDDISHLGNGTTEAPTGVDEALDNVKRTTELLRTWNERKGEDE